MKLSEHFTKEECECKCGCGFCDVDEKLLKTAESVREIIGNKPMKVHCVLRCKLHNKDVGGVEGSQHTKGKAMDFHCKRLPHEDVFKKILNAHKSGKLPFLRGVFLYDWGVHIDVRDDVFRSKDYRTKEVKT